MLGRLLMVASFIMAVPSIAGEYVSAGSASAPTQKNATEIAWDDLRWLATALEAYASDNDWLYAPTDGKLAGTVSDLDRVLEWYFANTFPKRSAPPRIDPWGRPYRFVVSEARKQYALYSSGANTELGEAEKTFIIRLKGDHLTEDDLKERNVSGNLVLASGSLVFAPAEIHRSLKPKN